MSFSVEHIKSPIGVNNIGFTGNKAISIPKTNPIHPDSFKKSGKSAIIAPSEIKRKIWEITNPSLLYQSYLSEDAIKDMMRRNPKIVDMLRNHGLADIPFLDNLDAIQKNHINSTVDYALAIANVLGLNAKDKRVIQKGALFHDFGKVLVPSELIDKTDKLNKREKRIVDLHSQLGYELLRTTPLEQDALQIVRNHHRPLYKNPDYRTQIVTIADIYSALVSERAYKLPYTHSQAIQTLKQYATKGKINPDIVKALETYINKSNIGITP